MLLLITYWRMMNQYFRIDTAGLTADQVESLKADLEKYSKWAKNQLKEE